VIQKEPESVVCKMALITFQIIVAKLVDDDRDNQLRHFRRVQTIQRTDKQTTGKKHSPHHNNTLAHKRLESGQFIL
jgi:hypothetical protein